MPQSDLRARTQQAARPAEQNGGGVAVRRDDPVALAAAPAYREDFAAVLPAHVNVDAFIHLAQNALRRDDKLMQVAKQNPASFIHALREAARLGHEPGTDAYYLTPRFGRDPGVLGIEGYKGVIERIYRAGAVSSVKVELVKERDEFAYDPGYDDRPRHRVNWFGDRGKVLGAYAYAVMLDGSISKVVVVDQERIDRAKAASSTADKSFSPWHTDYGAMVLKTAAHSLEPWVPTSSEYRKEQIRAAAEVAREEQQRRTIDVPLAPVPADSEVVNPAAGEVGTPDEVAWPAVARPGAEVANPVDFGAES